MELFIRILICLKDAALGKEGRFFSIFAIALTLFLPEFARFVFRLASSDFQSFVSFNLNSFGDQWQLWRMIQLPIYILPFWMAVIVSWKNKEIKATKSEWQKEVGEQEKEILESSGMITKLNGDIRILHGRQKELENLKKLKSENEQRISDLMGDLKAVKNRAAEAEALLATSQERANEAVSQAEKALAEIASFGSKASNQKGNEQRSIFDV